MNWFCRSFSSWNFGVFYAVFELFEVWLSFPAQFVTVLNRPAHDFHPQICVVTVVHIHGL